MPGCTVGSLSGIFTPGCTKGSLSDVVPDRPAAGAFSVCGVPQSLERRCPSRLRHAR